MPQRAIRKHTKERKSPRLIAGGCSIRRHFVDELNSKTETLLRVSVLYGLYAERGRLPPLCALPLLVFSLPHDFVYSLNSPRLIAGGSCI